MRRWVAILLFALATVYLGATCVDSCARGPVDDCPPICHLLCADGCATVPVPEAPAPPPPDAQLRPRFIDERVEGLVNLDIEPEKEPPRA